MFSTEDINSFNPPPGFHDGARNDPSPRQKPIPIVRGKRDDATGDKKRDAGAAAPPVAAPPKGDDEEGSQPEEQQENNGGEREEGFTEGGSLTLANLVVWFREFMTVLDDDAVGGGGGSSGGEGSWGSRPPRLLRVVDQRAGCAQEAVQLFVALCRGLGLRARYVACLDPVPPTPSLPSKQTRNNTVDLAAAAAGRQRASGAHKGGRRWGGSGSARASGSGVLGARASQAWAEVLCRDGDELVRRERKRVYRVVLRGGGEREMWKMLSRCLCGRKIWK